MNILILGSGGREHTLAWKLSQSIEVKRIFVIPGNSGMETEEKVETVPMTDITSEEIIKFSLENKIDFAVIGPEKYLTDGIAEILRRFNIPCLGPNTESAKLEGSKSFAKEAMIQAGIPTATYEKFTEGSKAISYLDQFPNDKQFVVKCDGLAAGKGVIVCDDIKVAKDAVDSLLIKNSLGLTYPEIIIEERLFGREVSAFYLCDGNAGLSLGHACDYKRIRDGNKGPNTGGMGAFGPVPWLKENTESEIKRTVVDPLLKVMNERGTPFKGILFIGLMMTNSGTKVLEFNVRFGDPETQVIIPLIKSDLLPYFMASDRGNLKELPNLHFYNQSALHIVLASEGYPGTEGKSVQLGRKITYNQLTEGKIFFSGVERMDNTFYTTGGRVMGVTVKSMTHQEAIRAGYNELKNIEFEGMQYRKDIGEFLEM
jgi:phosphoribosylamine--glycine ligase